MFIFFFLRRTGCFILGFSNDLRSRYKAHISGFVKATKYRRPLQLIHYEAFVEESDARRREKYLKGGNGRAELKQQLKTNLEKLRYQRSIKK